MAHRDYLFFFKKKKKRVELVFSGKAKQVLNQVSKHTVGTKASKKKKYPYCKGSIIIVKKIKSKYKLMGFISELLSFKEFQFTSKTFLW